MVETLTETFDDIKFTTTQFTALRGLKLAAQLVKQVGPALLALVSLPADLDLKDKRNNELVARTLMPAFANLEPDEFVQCVVNVLPNTAALVDGKAVPFGGTHAQSNIDLVFSARLWRLLRVVAWVVMSNFADFSVGSATPASADLPTPE